MKGIALTTVGWLILAIVCLVILIIIFSRMVPAIGQWMDSALEGLMKTVCDKLGPLSWFCHVGTGT
ncbi:MAG TPA: hypothetical protein VJ343_01915 [archaeon]|nr:hypothetical protein [archaeon]